MSKKKSKGRLFITQQNGRERGPENTGMGHWDDWNGGKAGISKSKKDIRDQDDRKKKSVKWED